MTLRGSISLVFAGMVVSGFAPFTHTGNAATRPRVPRNERRDEVLDSAFLTPVGAELDDWKFIN